MDISESINILIENPKFKKELCELVKKHEPKKSNALALADKSDPSYSLCAVTIFVDTEERAQLVLDQHEAIVKCRQVLDEIRGDWVPDFNDWGTRKCFPVFCVHLNKFRMLHKTTEMPLPKFWHLKSKACWHKALEQIGEETLYMALYGERLQR